VLLGSPLSSTFKRLGGHETNDADEWRSKEELAGLLVKAEDIIKERENGRPLSLFSQTRANSR